MKTNTKKKFKEMRIKRKTKKIIKKNKIIRKAV